MIEYYKIDENCFLVDLKYEKFIEVGKDFNGLVIIRIEKEDKLLKVYTSSVRYVI